jgi:hypothetical protein
MSPRSTRRKHSIADPFKGLRNIGPAARADLAILGITGIEQLAASDPDQLYTLLQIKTARKHDPCVWDVFAAAIHQARTGEVREWWAFTQERKLRQA